MLLFPPVLPPPLTKLRAWLLTAPFDLDVGAPVVVSGNPRQRIGVNQPPGGGSNFPFSNPSYDIRDLLGDFYLSYEDAACAFRPPFRVRWLYGFGTEVVAAPTEYPDPAHPRDVLVVDADDRVVFDSTTATDYLETEWNDRLLVIEWRGATGVCRCTQFLDWGPEDTPRTYDEYIVPASGWLDGRTYGRLAGRLRSLRVGLQTLTGDIIFEPGFNAVVSAAAEVERRDGARFLNRIDLDAVPGAGLGRAPGCQDTEALVRRINQVGPDATGNFIIDIDDCGRAELPLALAGDALTATPSATGYTATEAAAAIRLEDDCTVCCDCDDYVRTYRGLRGVWDTWQTVATNAQTARNQYEDNRERWQNARECRLANPLHLTLQPEADCKSFVGGSYCNLSRCCLAPVELRFTFRLFRGGSAYIWPSAGLQVLTAKITVAGDDTDYVPQINNTAEGTVVSFLFDYHDPQTTIVARMRVCVPCGDGDGLDVVVTAHAPPPRPSAIADATSCPPPVEVDIPAPVQAIWEAAGLDDAGVEARALLTRAAPLVVEKRSYECSC